MSTEYRQKQHEAGWVIYSIGRRLGELLFSQIEGHCYLFYLRQEHITETVARELEPLLEW